jgi:hypothetical protein
MRDCACHVREQVEIVGRYGSEARQPVGELGERKSCLHWSPNNSEPVPNLIDENDRAH